MYRFINKRNISLQNSCKISNMEYLPKICVFCNFCHRYTPKSLKIDDHSQLRHHSSNANAALLNPKEKLELKRKLKKYVEFLEASNSTTNNSNGTIQNLNAEYIYMMRNQPDIILNKLHKIEEKYFMNKETITKSDMTSLKNLVIDQDLKNSVEISSPLEISNNVNKISNYDLIDIQEKADCQVIDENSLIKNSQFNKSIKNSQKKIINKSLSLIKSNKKGYLKEDSQIKDANLLLKILLIKKNKLKQFNQIMLAYTNVCINCGDSFLRDTIIDLYKKWKMSNASHINSIDVFNIIIEKFSSNSDFENLLSILKYLKKANIQRNTQTYAYIFNCIGRMEYSNKQKSDILKKIKLEMYCDGISLNDILVKCVFVRDQRKYVENAIKILDNEFQPIYKIPDIKYDCELLKNFSKESAVSSSTVEGLLTKNGLKECLEQQIKLEMDGQVKIRSIAKSKASIHEIAIWKKKVSNQEEIWKKVAFDAFKRNLTSLKNIELQESTKIKLYPFLSILNPEDYVHIIMNMIRVLGSGSEAHSIPYTTLCNNLGIQIYKKYELKLKRDHGLYDKTIEVYLQYCDWIIDRNDKLNFREKWTLLEHESNKYGVTLNFELPQWTNNIQIRLGAFLFNIILNDFKLNLVKKKSFSEQNVPAFFKVFRFKGLKQKEEVKPNPILAKMYRKSNPETLFFDTTFVPTLCPPRPWTSACKGGYIITSTNIVRVSQLENQQWRKLKNTIPNKLYPSLDSLNQLGSISWTINTKILDLVIKIFQDDGSDKLNIPRPVSVLTPISIPKNSTDEEKKKLQKAKMDLNIKKIEIHSLWCDTLYRLSIANHFRDKIFWLPHNMDFRGRVYPIPPHLNHLGSDLARSLLVFALKKPLGPKGLDWLKLHAINLTGLMKLESISKRLRYADEILDKILDSAEKPLEGEMWWASSENPWQTLAVCTEIAAALKSPNPEEFLSGFPIHQDGSCNGLQHYAALGRDEVGARSVNLESSEVPQDVYSTVVTMIEKQRVEDAKNGDKIAQILEGFIVRKVIKQTVMTTVYGVTWFGAKLQIYRQLADLDKFPLEFAWAASLYLVYVTFGTLRSMFKSARKIQDWFTEICGYICALRKENMQWVTPLGLPVVQPYSKDISNSSIKSKNIHYTTDLCRKPHVMKQKNAFPPNFIHSLDSSHMMLTSIYCEHAGITFVSVHDCFWTHPCSVEIMNKICREQFVSLHSDPILEDLSQFLLKTFVTNTNNDSTPENKKAIILKKKLTDALLRVPEKGDFDLKKVLSSTYFFS